MALEALSRVLWRERELLELLLFKLEEEQLVLASAAYLAGLYAADSERWGEQSPDVW